MDRAGAGWVWFLVSTRATRRGRDWTSVGVGRRRGGSAATVQRREQHRDASRFGLQVAGCRLVESQKSLGQCGRGQSRWRAMSGLGGSDVLARPGIGGLAGWPNRRWGPLAGGVLKKRPGGATPRPDTTGSGHWPLVFSLSRAHPLKPCIRMQSPFNCCIFHHLANMWSRTSVWSLQVPTGKAN